MQTFGAKLKADLGDIHSEVDSELRRRQQAQVRPLSPIPYTLENTSALGRDRSKQGESYLSDYNYMAMAYNQQLLQLLNDAFQKATR